MEHVPGLYMSMLETAEVARRHPLPGGPPPELRRELPDLARAPPEDQKISNSPKAPMPPPSHVTTPYLAPRFDLEQKTLQTIDNPFGSRLSPMS